MFSFEYTIHKNAEGRPYILPTKKTEKELDLTEHKFMGVELTVSIIENTLKLNEENPIKYNFPQKEIDRLSFLLKELYEISNLYAHALIQEMKAMNETNMLLNPQIYDIQIDLKNELFGLNYNGIIYGDTIFRREEGLRVKVLEDKKIYELRGGIDNNNWVDVTTES